MMRRVRSSPRWPTSVSRSSWPPGRRAVAMELSCGYPAGSGAGLRLLGALLPDRLGGRRGPGGGGAGVVVVLVALRLAGHGVLELAHARAELTPERRQPLGAEDDEDDDQDDDELEWADVGHGASSGRLEDRLLGSGFTVRARLDHGSFKFL